MKTKNLLLCLATLVFILMVGGATYEHIAVVPSWSAAPPASLSMFQGEYGLNAQYFWMSIHPVALLLLIISLIMHWRTRRRKPILIVLTSYVIILIITSIYFVPELLAITGTTYAPTADTSLTERASLWEALSLVRLVFLYILCMLLLGSLTRSEEQQTVRSSGQAPLTYPNDALGG